MTFRLILAAVWLVGLLLPLGWWLRSRRQVDLWRSIPLPTVLLDADGTPVGSAGPDSPVDFKLPSGLPAPGRVLRSKTADGTPVAIAGVRGGAVAVAVPADPVTDRRDRLLAELAPRLAHDVYTPLTAITGHLDLLAHEPISEAARQSVRICQAEIDRIATLSKDLLALTAVRSGAAVRQPTLAGALAEEAVAGLLGTADEAGASLSVEVPAERVLVNVAEGDLIRALRNLILNALRHGLGDRRAVTVGVTADQDTVTFSVADSGPGVPPDQLERLCEPLVRGDGVTVSGSGLGLAIVADVLAAHGSQLAVSNSPEGAAFSFALPRIRP